ncbi:MAG: NADPH-dependent FMN reductase [Dehalococcoidia bacterium]
MTQLVGVLGSVTPPGRLLQAVEYSLASAREAGPSIETSLINLADVRIGYAGAQAAEEMDDDTPSVVQTIAGADAVLFASPVYRASYTGVLKNLLDLLPVEALMGKPCAILAMGATQHHYLGVDWHLRDVLTWFGAVTLPSSVYLASSDFSEGKLTDGAKSSLKDLATTLVRFQAMLPKGAESLRPMPLAAQRRG